MSWLLIDPRELTPSRKTWRPRWPIPKILGEVQELLRSHGFDLVLGVLIEDTWQLTMPSSAANTPSSPSSSPSPATEGPSESQGRYLSSVKTGSGKGA